jgi:hypothetical protein
VGKGEEDSAILVGDLGQDVVLVADADDARFVLIHPNSREFGHFADLAAALEPPQEGAEGGEVGLAALGREASVGEVEREVLDRPVADLMDAGVVEESARSPVGCP